MKYRVIHDCDGYRIQKSLFGVVWFDTADTYFYEGFRGYLCEFTIPSKTFYREKSPAMESAKRLKFRLKYKGHTIRSDKNFFVDLNSFNWFEGYTIWSRNLDDVKKQIDKEIERKKSRKNAEIFPV